MIFFWQFICQFGRPAGGPVAVMRYLLKRRVIHRHPDLRRRQRRFAHTGYAAEDEIPLPVLALFGRGMSLILSAAGCGRVPTLPDAHEAARSPRKHLFRGWTCGRS